MPISPRVKERLVGGMRRDLERARSLHEMLVLHGRTQYLSDQSPAPLRQPDKRDVTAFIFLEAAAKFEAFCAAAFMLEVRSRFNITPKRAVFVMGSVDKGLTGVYGWGSPKVLRQRAEHLFGRTGFFARIDVILGDVIYQRIVHAHVVRNRIVHSGGKASADFNKILAQLQVPARSRRGLSVGRLLLDYPADVDISDRWFYRFLHAYGELVDKFESECECA